jgi:hypothetical protein
MITVYIAFAYVRFPEQAFPILRKLEINPFLDLH